MIIICDISNVLNVLFRANETIVPMHAIAMHFISCGNLLRMIFKCHSIPFHLRRTNVVVCSIFDCRNWIRFRDEKTNSEFLKIFNSKMNIFPCKSKFIDIVLVKGFVAYLVDESEFFIANWIFFVFSWHTTRNNDNDHDKHWNVNILCYFDFLHWLVVFMFCLVHPFVTGNVRFWLLQVFHVWIFKCTMISIELLEW